LPRAAPRKHAGKAAKITCIRPEAVPLPNFSIKFPHKKKQFQDGDVHVQETGDS
jgi:hypothetical protein